MQLRTLATILLLTACSPKPSTTGIDSGSTTAETDGASVTSASDSMPTTEAPLTTTGSTVTTTVPATSSSSSGTGVVTGTATESGEETGGGGLLDACADVCAHWDMCSPGSVGRVDVCTTECIDGFVDPPECAAAIAAQWSCVAGLSCEEALKFLDGDPTSCLEQLDAADSACAGEGCGGDVGGDEETCTKIRECGDGKQEYTCEGDVCTCKQDDIPGKQCPADGFCALGDDEQSAAITACCGWVWEF